MANTAIDCAFRIKLCDITNFCTSVSPTAVFDYSGRYLKHYFRIHVSPYEQNQNFLSIMFVTTPWMLTYINDSIHTFEFSCMASVIDVNGDGRFRQSFVFVQDPENSFDLDCLKFGFEEYVNTDVLLSNSSELLSGDSLTVSIEIIFRHRCSLTDIFWLETLHKFFVEDGDKFYFNLDSLFGKMLCDYSKVFQCLSETAMIERKTRRVYVSPEEYIPLQHILKFIIGASVRIKLSEYIPLMWEICIVAEKYDMKVVVEACRHCLESTLNSINDWKFFEHVMENILKLSEFAERFDDMHLRDCIQKILGNRENVEAQLREKMKMESDLLETKSTVCLLIRRVVDYKQNPQLDKMRAEPSSLT